MTTDLYRHYAADGTLLYVGISLCTASRMLQHRAESKWLSRSARIEIERFPFRWLAEEAEKTAILTEKPLFNIIHTKPRQPPAPPKARQIKPSECPVCGAHIGLAVPFDRKAYMREYMRARRKRDRQKV